MVINLIYSVLLLIAGSVIAAAILLFGVKFCKDGGELGADPTWKDIFLQIMRGYPFWVWIFAFMVFQPAIIHIINTWCTTLLETYAWTLKLSDFIAFIAVALYTFLVRITDDNGRLRKFLKKSKWNSSKISLRIRGEIFHPKEYYFNLPNLNNLYNTTFNNRRNTLGYFNSIIK